MDEAARTSLPRGRWITVFRHKGRFMAFFPPTLHSRIAQKPKHVGAIEQALTRIRKPAAHLHLAMAARPISIDIPITTVSLDRNFDAFINVSFAGAPAGSATTPLIVDSGNSTLIVPQW